MQVTHRTGMRRAWSAALWWLCAAAIPIASALAIFADEAVRGGPAQVSAAAHVRFHTRVLMTEAAVLVIAAPLAGIISVRRRRRADDERVQPAGVESTLVRAWHVAAPLLTGASVLVATSVLMVLALRTPFDVTIVSASHAVLWSAAFALGALGALCASVFSDVLDAAASAIGVSLVSAVGVFAAGPALSDVPVRVLQAVLFANPIVTTAASANVDIFRTELLYQLSPLAHSQFTYPQPGAAITGYILTALLLLLGTARVSRSPRDSERISA